MAVKLTKKQKQLIAFLDNFMVENGYSPSYREIAAGMGLKSVASVAEHIDNLVALGALKRDPGEPRSLQIVDLSYPETTSLFRTKLSVASEEDAEVLKKAANILGLDIS